MTAKSHGEPYRSFREIPAPQKADEETLPQKTSSGNRDDGVTLK
jgi:hypothetical protein